LTSETEKLAFDIVFFATGKRNAASGDKQGDQIGRIFAQWLISERLISS
jgi:hypothetical protein